LRIHDPLIISLIHISFPMRSSHGRPCLQRLRSTRLGAPLLAGPIHPTTPHVPRGSAPCLFPRAPLCGSVEQQRCRRLWLLGLSHRHRASPVSRRHSCRGQRRHAAQLARPSPFPPSCVWCSSRLQWPWRP
jgi:hypothetical protein